MKWGDCHSKKKRQHRRIRAWVTLELKCQLPQGHLIYRFAHTLTLTHTKTSQSEPFKEPKRQEGEQSGVGGLSRVDGVAKNNKPPLAKWVFHTQWGTQKEKKLKKMWEKTDAQDNMNGKIPTILQLVTHWHFRVRCWGCVADEVVRGLIRQ